MRHLAIEHLPRELSRLFENRAPILGVGIVAKVRALVDEAAAAPIHHDPKWITVLLKAVADAQVSELRRISIPAHGVAAGPVPARHRADFERHPDSVASVEAAAANFDEVPARPE